MLKITEKQPWHALTSEETLQLLHADKHGLTNADALARMQEYGRNQLAKPKSSSVVKKIIRQFNNILIYILLVAAIIMGFLAQWLDMAVIMAVVILNAAVGVIQEGKAEQALIKIRQLLHIDTKVYRDGKLQQLPAEELVPGDIVVVKAGDKVPADIRLLTSHTLAANEAILTGESLPQEKATAVVAPETVLADRSSMIYSSTLITHGRGMGIVVATGEETEVGRISQLLASAEQLTTPLLQQMLVFGRWLTLFIVLAAVVTFCIGYYVQHYSVQEIFLAAISLAVAAIPEGLPAIMTITLAIGVTRMVNKNAIIRLLPAVDTMGSITVICTDKTGTLTLNELTVQDIYTAEQRYQMDDLVSDKPAKITLDQQTVNQAERNAIEAIARAALLCNELEHMNPIDEALSLFAKKVGLDEKVIQQQCQTIDLIHFSSERKYMASLHQVNQQPSILYIKGAPELILAKCQKQYVAGQEIAIDNNYWEKALQELTAEGKRVLALAYENYAPTTNKLQSEAINNEFVLLGLLGLIDPPRPETKAAVADCRAAGIKVKVITGDHAATTKAVANMIALNHNQNYLTGDQIDALDDQALLEKLDDVDIFARTTPKHKMRLVKLLQQQHHIVAMTGDGVNDAPAVQQANIGIAMGIKGTEVTKDAAEMVLADDNFATIRDAIKEGRTVYDNLKKAILFILPTSFAEAFIIITAVMTGMVLPITPLQILWINMVTTVTLALALGFEKSETDVMQRPPRPTNQSLLSGFLLWRIIFVASLFLIGIFTIFFYYQSIASLELARTITVNTIVMAESFYLFNCRYLASRKFIHKDLFLFKPVLIAVALTMLFQLGFTYLPFMQFLFHSRPLLWQQWLLVIAFAFVVFFIVQIEKRYLRFA